ncbi:MAG: VTT domain-containing protein [Dehalococcoidia bacterium]|nr:VTT domain-containing protein [Dehalococcoidia bacterium]
MAKEVVTLEDVDKAAGPRRLPRWTRLYTSIALVAGALLIMALALLFGRGLSDFQSYGYFGIWLMAVIGAIAPVWVMPGWLAAFIGGGLLNPLLVGLVVGTGELVGELIGYMIGHGGQIAVEKLKFYPTLERWMKRHGVIVMFLFSAVPNPATKAADAAAGALRLPLWKFAAAVWTGKVLKSLAFAFAGYYGLTSIVDLFHRIFG